MMVRTKAMAALVLSLTLALAFSVGIAAGQTPFALTNIGQRIDSDDARMVGRGGWGMAVSDSLHPGFKNIAGLSAVRHVAIKYTGFGAHILSSDGSVERKTNRTITPDIRVALPIMPGKLVFSTGFEISRSNQYRTLTKNTWYAWDDTLTGNEQFTREGSLWSVPLGLSLEVLPGLSLGGTLGLVNGTIRETIANLFLYPANNLGYPLYLANGSVKDDQFSGTNVTLSLLASPGDRLKIGASWCPAYDISVERKVEVAGVGQRFTDVQTYGLPAEYKAGFDLRLANRWRIGGDGQLMKFKDFTGRDDWSSAMEDEFTFGVGLERTQDYERHGGLKNLPIRVGYRYRHWGYQMGGNPVKELSFSLGTGFPFSQMMGQLDLALSYGIIGDQVDNGFRSRVWQFTMSFTGLEKWW